MKIPLVQFPYQPHKMECCEECKKIEFCKRDCYPNPMNCKDFYIWNKDFIENKLVGQA